MTSMVETPVERAPSTVVRLLVTVRDSSTSAYRAVGFLSQEQDGFRFAYLRRERERARFRPLPGLARASDHSIWSPSLFPVFAERVIAARRPDRMASLAALGLGADAAPFEVLVRSHGQRVGDTIELLPAPEAGPGDALTFTFLTHGVRYLPDENQMRITALRRGDPLLLQPDTANTFNPQAQLVTDLGKVSLGWVPEPLIEVIESVSECQLSVEQANGPEVGFHFRLLARLTGFISIHDRALFSGQDWSTVD